jgi:hypothetical protein
MGDTGQNQEADERVARRGRGGAHPGLRRFTGPEDTALRQAVDRVASDPIYLFRWDQVVEQLAEGGFPRRTEKSVRNRYLRLTRKPTIHDAEKKNRCRFCGEYTRGHSCPGMNPKATECVSSKSPVC